MKKRVLFIFLLGVLIFSLFVISLEEASEQLSKEEERKAYLNKELTKILADKKIIGPALFYTHKFFSFFNPFWELVFGLAFAWSWAFFLSIFIWGVLIFLLYMPTRELFKNQIMGIMFSIAVGSLIGVLKVIAKAVDILETAIVDLWRLSLFVLIVILLLAAYGWFMKESGKDAKKEELERAKENIKAHGRVSKGALEELGK